MSTRQARSVERPHRQIDFASARKILGLIGRNYSDAELEGALEAVYGLCELVYHFMEEGHEGSIGHFGNGEQDAAIQEE